MSQRKVIIVSGGFDPLHAGHIKYLKAAKELGSEVIVILNTDEFLKRKKGFIFLPFNDRYDVLNSIKYVDVLIQCIDEDQSVCKTLKFISEVNAGEDELIFAKGGDRNADNIPEIETCKQLGIEIVYGVGGEKIQSSSELYEKALGQLQGIGTR